MVCLVVCVNNDWCFDVFVKMCMLYWNVLFLLCFLLFVLFWDFYDIFFCDGCWCVFRFCVFLLWSLVMLIFWNVIVECIFVVLFLVCVDWVIVWCFDLVVDSYV